MVTSAQKVLPPLAAWHQPSNNYNCRSIFNVAKCNLGNVKKETMIVSGHIRKYVGLVSVV